MMYEQKVEKINSYFKQMHSSERVTFEMVNKNNITRPALILKKPEDEKGIVIYGDTLNPNLSDEEIAKELDRIYDENMRVLAKAVTLPASKANVLSNVFPEVVAREGNPYLDDKIFLPLLDMAVVFMIGVGENMRAAITRRNFEALGIPLDELEKHARENIKHKAECIPLTQVLEELMCEKLPEEQGALPIYVVTTPERLYGAGCLFSDKYLESLRMRFGSDYYIIPSSVHELLILPVGIISPDELYEMNKEVNETKVSDEERLITGIYKYSANGLEKVR